MNHNEYEETGSKALRAAWEFPFPAQAVAKAAEQQRQHHARRMAWWEKTARTVEATLRKKGFEYREREVTGGARLEVVGDPELVKRIGEAKRKIREHRESARTYATWTRALKTVSRRPGGQPLQLTIGDILFFGL